MPEWDAYNSQSLERRKRRLKELEVQELSIELVSRVSQKEKIKQTNKKTWGLKELNRNGT